jgi:hypothetical protein
VKLGAIRYISNRRETYNNLNATNKGKENNAMTQILYDTSLLNKFTLVENKT